MPNSSEQDYSMSIEKSSETEDEASESYEVYESYEIDLERDGEEIDETEDEVNISFTVEKAWIEEKSLSREDVSLLHREGDSWEPKETSVSEVRDNSVVYSAVTGEFSDYMVGADKDEACTQEVITAKSPDGMSCRTFTDSCEVPDNWSQVQSCQIVEDRAQARQLIADLPDDNPDVRDAKDAFQAGNYSEALTVARSANESINSKDNDEFRGDTQSSQQGGLMSMILGALASVVGLGVLSYGSYFGYMKYRKREMLEELNQITEVIRKGMRSGEIRRDQNVLEQIDIARSKIKSGRYDAANEDMEQLKNYLESIRR